MHETLVDQVLQASAIKVPGIYLLGPVSGRISFSSQQHRALNLVSAIRHRGLVRSGDAVAIIGAGLSGLTAATALIGLGCDVSVYEARSQPLSIERVSHRQIHPTINLWPTSQPSITTKLPFLDWVAGDLSSIAKDVWDQAGPALEGRIHSGVVIKDIHEFPDGSLGLRAQPPIRDARFRIVIVTDDLGREREMPGLSHASYWLPDNLEQESRSGQARTFVISGCGDGGLIDALRLAHGDYGRGRLVQEVAEELYATEISETIRAGEAFALSKMDAALLGSVYTDAAARIDTDPVYAALSQRLRNSSERAPEIILTDIRLNAPYSLEAAPIHKLLIADALRRGVVWYLRGGVTLADDSVMVGDRRIGDRTETCVIVRHGAELSVAHLFSDNDLQDYRRRSAALPGSAFPLLWPGEIVVPPEMPEPVASNAAFLKSRLPMAQRAIKSQFDADVAIEIGAFGIVADDGSSLKLPEQLFGVPVRVRSRQAASGAGHDPLPVRVFLSYATADRQKAREISVRLSAASLKVVEDEWESSATVPAFAQPSFGLAASDVVLVLVSPRSLDNPWVQLELGTSSTSKEFRDRKIRVAPVLLEGAEVPASLRRYRAFDLTQDFDARLADLVDELSAASLIDFSRLDGAAFERLVIDLLGDLGFNLSARTDGKSDFEALYEDIDPFGASRVSRWAIIVKHRRKHLSIAEISAVSAQISAMSDLSIGVVVTSSRLTSVARAYIARANASSGTTLRIVDGADLSDLLQRRPALIRRHLSPGEAI